MRRGSIEPALPTSDVGIHAGCYRGLIWRAAGWDSPRYLFGGGTGERWNSFRLIPRNPGYPAYSRLSEMYLFFGKGEMNVKQLTADWEPRTTAVVALFENVWAGQFRRAVEEAGGEVVLAERIPRRVIDELEAKREAAALTD